MVNDLITAIDSKMDPELTSFSKGDVLLVEVREKSKTLGFYEIVFTHKKAELFQIPVKTDATDYRTGRASTTSTFVLDNLKLGEAGQDYSLQIIRYKSYDEMLREKDKNGHIIYQRASIRAINFVSA